MRRLLPLAALLAAVSAHAAERIGFVVRCVEEHGAARRILYQSSIDGPPRTDFTIRIRDRGYTLDADFVNEPVLAGIDVRVHLTSRRRQGTSHNGLPLWEEDEQKHRLTVRFDQAIHLLPFGRAGEAGLLKFEVLPARAAGDSDAPIRIRIDQPGAQGTIAVDAYVAPHWYRADVEVAGSRASGRLFAGEPASVGDVTITASPTPHADVWTYTDVVLAGRPITGIAAATVCRSETATVPLTGQRTLHLRIAPESISPTTKGTCR